MQIDRPIVIAITLFIILLLIFFLVKPEYNKFKILQQELGEKRAEYNAEFDYYNAIATAYKELHSREESIKKINDALPSESSFGKLVYFFQKKGIENGVIIKNFFLNKSSSASGENLKDVGFSMNLLGSYESLGNFIRSLEKSSRLFEITSIAFGSGDRLSSGFASNNESQPQIEQIYSFNLEIKTHSY